MALPSGEDASAGYRWSQTHEEVEVVITIPAGTKGGDCKVTVQPTSLSVVAPGRDELTLCPLYAHVIPASLEWTLSGTELMVTLEKEEKPTGVLKPAKAAKAWKTILAADAS
mmetsp:Transcript_28617/g.46046  ORF Transcript_28617/g.46046 Transcript_28617/m.46046 type:complete len:112 (+) Transcript_28617:65-400(+)|eukprot:CAMPEP_0169160860 /NCGR_PEP_ID=MMETSP1015-20121227/56712_1 /TAXON_ID=342587 /ORGANISM="Karlodinium micrum, Strain CCMP2283" /LENGTH=111 /DNA_ID=CAMNT_0009232629 /DNA_START=59 /DNA_END=391 /DNA_ORIENTATION=+